jgi:hypothetical protein
MKDVISDSTRLGYHPAIDFEKPASIRSRSFCDDQTVRRYGAVRDQQSGNSHSNQVLDRGLMD